MTTPGRDYMDYMDPGREAMRAALEEPLAEDDARYHETTGPTPAELVAQHVRAEPSVRDTAAYIHLQGTGGETEAPDRKPAAESGQLPLPLRLGATATPLRPIAPKPLAGQLGDRRRPYDEVSEARIEETSPPEPEAAAQQEMAASETGQQRRPIGGETKVALGPAVSPVAQRPGPEGPPPKGSPLDRLHALTRPRPQIAETSKPALENQPNLEAYRPRPGGGRVQRPAPDRSPHFAPKPPKRGRPHVPAELKRFARQAFRGRRR